MPIYNLKGEAYNIPDDVVEQFENDNPDATIRYNAGGDDYDIPVKEKKGFLQAFPQAKIVDMGTSDSHQNAAASSQDNSQPYAGMTVNTPDGMTYTAAGLDSMDKGAKPVVTGQSADDTTDAGTSTTVDDENTPGSAAWRNRVVVQPGDNPYNGKTFGEVYDQIIQGYGKNFNNPDIDPYAEARAQIMQAGITDDMKPEDVDMLARNIHAGYANRFAQGNAKAMVSALPDQVPNIDQLMDGLWYNRDLQQKLGYEAMRLGLDQKTYTNHYVKPQLAKALSDRYGYDVNSAKSIAARLMSDDKFVMNVVRQNEANDMIGRYAEPKIQEYFDRTLSNAEQKFNAQLGNSPMMPTGNAGAVLGASLNYYRNTDPAKVWEQMKPNIDQMAKDIVDVDFVIEAEERAEEEGLSIDQYLESRILPNLQAQIQSQFEQMAMEREMPTDTTTYLLGKIRESIIGQVGNVILASKSRRRMQAEAMQRTETGQGKYKPGFGAEVGGAVASMLPDMMFGGPFGLSAKGAAALMPLRGTAQELISEGMRPLFARMIESSLVGAQSLGTFEGVKGAIRGAGEDRYDSFFGEDKRSAGEILEDIVYGGMEGALSSSLAGASMIGGPLGQKVSNGRGVLANMLGWGTQVGVDAATATALSIPKLITGDVTLEDLGHEFAHNIGTFAALGLNHKIKDFASLAGGGRSWNGVEFSKQDIETLESRFLSPFRKQIEEIEGAQNRKGLISRMTSGSDAQQHDAVNSAGTIMYNDLMHSYAVPRELKVKVAQALSMPIPEYALKPEVLQLEKDVTAKSIDLGWLDAVNNDYNKPGGVLDKVKNGEHLDDYELTLRLLFQDNAAYDTAVKKQEAGVELTPAEQKVVEDTNRRLAKIYQQYAANEHGRLAGYFEVMNGLEPGTIDRMMRDAAEGKAVDSNILNEYEEALRDYNRQLDEAEAQRKANETVTAENSAEQTPVAEVPATEAPTEEAPKVNRVVDNAEAESPADSAGGESKPAAPPVNKKTGTVMEVQLIDGRKAYIVDGDPADGDGLLSLVDENGQSVRMTDQGGYTMDRFPSSIIQADEKGAPIIAESKPAVETSMDEAPKAEDTADTNDTPEGSASSRIKTAKDGTELWEQTPVEDVVAELRESEGDDAIGLVNDQIADIQSQLKELTKPVKGKQHMTMTERRNKKNAVRDAQKSLDFWNQVKAELENTAEEPAQPAEQEQPLSQEPPKEPATPPTPPAESAQPAGTTAEQKIAQGTVKNNVGKRYGFTNQDGTRSEVVINTLKGDGQVTVTRQDYGADGKPKGEAYQQDLNTVDVGKSIVSGLMKPALSTDEKLRKVFKYKVGDVPVIDVLTEQEKQQLLDLYAKGDKEAQVAIGNLTGDLIHDHHEDLILRERDMRNDKVAQIMGSNASREQKLRRVRDLYKGFEESEVMLEDGSLTPTTLEEYVADLHSRVPKSGEGPIAYFSYEKDGTPITGMQDESGYGKKNSGDADAFKPWLAPQGKGMSLLKYAEQIHSQLPEPIQEQFDVNEVRNAILNVFGGAERPSDITTMVIRRGVLQAEQAARRMEDMWIEGGPSFHRVSADDSSFTGRLERAKQQTNTEPSDAQKEKGNYKKGHVSFGGYDFVVENPEGSMRRGEADGKKWEQKMNNTYGYILGRYGKDGDHLDMFINDAADLDNWNGNVYVVDQVNPKTGEFDEHKVMYGFNSEAEARDAYLSNYEKGWQGLGRITGVSKDKFDEWLDSSKRKRVPFADHSIITNALKNEEQAGTHTLTDAEINQAMRDKLIDISKESGVPISTDVEEGQPIIDDYNRRMSAGETTDDGVKPQKVTDKDELEQLNSGKTVKRYRAMQLIDGKLYPPMSAKVDGEMREPTEIGVWEKAEERPDLVKNGKFVLNKAQKGQSNVPAAYNPYFHTSTSGLNDQFTSAYKRPELVVVEVEIPESELSSGYKAEGAKDAVGDVPWHSGVVNGQLPADRQRQVTLSRYSKVNRIVPDSEVADMIAKQLEGTNVEVPYNVVTPIQRAELEKRGVKISDKPAGTVTEDINGNPIKQQKADVVDMYAKNVDISKPVEETIPSNPTVFEALNIKDRVEAMSPQELIENYRRINSQMLDENGLNVDELEENRRHKYISEHGIDKGFGKAMADHLKMLSDKYGYGKLALRWDLQDRIKELGLEDYLDSDEPYNPGEKTAVPEKTKADVVDMHGRPMFFKTANGQAYGFTYRGKIYIDPRIATSETPIHEYGHLWVEMKRKTSPDEWNHIKDVLMKDKLIQPFIEQVKRDYPELEGKDDDFVEEVLTQFSGKRGAEKLRRMADEIKQDLGGDATAQTIAEAAIRRVKSVLNEFWKGVCDMMGWKYTSAEDIADAVLRDMLNGVNPTERVKEASERMKEQLMGKAGAAEADRADNDSRRMDNLKLAEEAEKGGYDAKAIKFATGWERGADGKWRYEIPDADIDIVSAYKQARQEHDKEVARLSKAEDDLLERYQHLYDKIPKRLDSRYTEEQKAKYREMRKEMAKLWKQYIEAGEKVTEYDEQGVSMPLGELIGEDNELFKYYPQLKDMKVSFSTMQGGTAGSFSKDGIKIGVDELKRFDNDELNNENVYGTLLHEVEHAIQEIEGFAEGGSLLTSTTEEGIKAIIEKKQRQADYIKLKLDANRKILNSPEELKAAAELEGRSEKEVKDRLLETIDQEAAEYDTLKNQIAYINHYKAPAKSDAVDLYHRLAGEVESRNVEARMKMTDEERMTTLASETEDVPRDEQVIISGNTGGRDRYVMDNGEKILAYDEKMTPEQEALLRGHNFREYPSIQELSSGGKGTKKSDTLQGKSENSASEGQENENNSLKFQRVSNPEPEMTEEERQYWKKWSDDLKKWKERNGLPADAEEPGAETPKQPDEDMMDYVMRIAKHRIEKAKWQTAPRLEDYHQMRSDKDTVEAARENLQRFPGSIQAKMRLAAAEFQQIRSAMGRQKAYDKATVKAVADFAHEYMTMGFGDNLSRGEVERLLSTVKNATGAKDIRESIDNVMNILTDNYLRNLDQQVQKLSSVKELAKTAQGVEKQGKLELKGQRMIQAFRDARQSRMTADEIRERMAEVSDYMTRDTDEAPMWEQEYEGLAIALKYAEDIDGSRSEWGALDREYKDAVREYNEARRNNSGTGRTYAEQQQYLDELDKAMMDNKLERIGKFGEIIGRLQGNIAESMEGAKEFREREKERIKHIHDIANFDLAGKDMGAMREKEKQKGKPANFFLQPLGTFEQMLKQFGSRNAKGEGMLYDYFMRSWMDATDKAFTNEQKAKEELDEKAREVFGDKVKRWSDLYDIVRKLPTMELDMLDGEDRKTFTLTQGNLLYIYMADKMNDGRMKLRKMGIDEEEVQQVKEFLDPRLVQLGDWLQEEYLPKKRTEYNKVHERMFGAPMAAIDHYYPIKILGDARVKEEDVNVPDSETLPSTITGNIIKRRKNVLPLDVLHTDALSLAIEHIEDMERWAAQAEWNKDVNTLLSYTTFRNKVKNMKTIYGSGDKLWEAFKDAAKMAAGTYRSSVKDGGVDKAISNVAKGVTAAKINFRVYTAFKQLLSAPAFVHDVDLGEFVKAGANPYGSWKWAMENMPVFEKRWKSRQVGDTRLMDDETDWKLWKNNVVKIATRLGMSPNALVDGVTCAVGARAIYESRYKKYKDMGASDEDARKQALQDAEIGYNLTQQSSEGAFVSRIQKDRTLAANMLSVFRNSSMAYTRQWVDAARNLKHRMQPGYKEDSIKFMKRQLQDRFNLDEEQATQAAEAEYARAGRHEVAKMLNMMFGVTVAWNLGASLPYLLIGDDRETKKEMLTDALLRGLVAGPTEGFAAGNIWSELMADALSEQTRKTVKEEGLGAGLDAAWDQVGDYEINPLPFLADLQGMIKKLGYDKFAFLQDVFNICMQSAVGVNPQTFTDMFNAAADYAMPGWDGTSYTLDKKNLGRAKEFALFVMRLMNAPTSSWRNKYIDELGMDAEDAQKLPYDEMARRYAHYKHWKDAPIMGWLRGEEGRQAKIEKIQKQFDKAVQERMGRLTDKELENAFNATDNAAMRQQLVKQEVKRADSEDALGKTTSKDESVQKAVDLYARHRTWQDLVDDLELAKVQRQLRAENKESLLLKHIEIAVKVIKEYRNHLTGPDDVDGLWQKLREKRDEILKKIREEQPKQQK